MARRGVLHAPARDCVVSDAAAADGRFGFGAESLVLGCCRGVGAWLVDLWGMAGSFWGWLADLGWGDAKLYVAPLMVVALVTPLVVVLSLLLVAVLMTPALVALVAQRRFHLLERKKGGSLCFESGVVGRLYGACVGGDGRVHATVADTAAGVDLAPAYLGVVDLPGDGV